MNLRRSGWILGTALAAALGVAPAAASVDERTVPLTAADLSAGLVSGSAGLTPAPAAHPGEPLRPALMQSDPVGIILPPPPAATVTIGAGDAFAGALDVFRREARAGIWPARLAKRDRDAILAFYAARGDRPLLVENGRWSALATAAAGRLRHADEDGLDAAAYPVPSLGRGQRPESPAELVEAEMKLAGAVALYARDARGGRIEPSRLSALVTPKLDLPPPEAVLTGLAAAADAGAALGAYNPAYPGYRALRAKLAEIRAGRATQPMARATPRREVMTTQAIAVIDDVPGPLAPLPTYARPVSEADVLANMERWRWLPAEVADKGIFVNIPEFKVRVVERDRVIHEARVITGKPESPTPVFSGTMEYAVVNPSWYIPPSIMKKEILPGLAADPSYAARRGYEVIRRGNAVTVRQPPGERNALGFIKFMFPNGHAVYLHDTPNRALFGAARRAMSHGCVRVDQPFAFADVVLGHEWSEARLRKLIGRGERTIFLPQKLSVHLSYFTVTVDETGELRTFEDIYGLNRRVRAALGLAG